MWLPDGLIFSRCRGCAPPAEQLSLLRTLIKMIRTLQEQGDIRPYQNVRHLPILSSQRA